MKKQTCDKVLAALKAMIENDETMRYLTAPNGDFDLEDENAYWLNILQTAQQTYFEATGEVVANSAGVVLIPGMANEDQFGFIFKPD